MHTYIHTYIRKYTYADAKDTDIYSFLHAYTHAHIQKYTTQMQKRRTYVDTCMHTYIQTYTHKYSHTDAEETRAGIFLLCEGGDGLGQ